MAAKDITVSELMEAKDFLEADLTQVITEALFDFVGQTGIGVDSVDVQMVNVTTMVERRQRYMVGLVYVDLAL